jgi:hypothetical protein
LGHELVELFASQEGEGLGEFLGIDIRSDFLENFLDIVFG